jgi:hypothetical protein
MKWQIDGPPCAPRDIDRRLEQRINPQSQHRIKLQWVLDGWKWKRNPYRFQQPPRPDWRAAWRAANKN